MKYLKLFENKKMDELKELIPELNDLCQDLKDHEYQINIYNEYVPFFTFPKAGLSYQNQDRNTPSLEISITKYDKYFYIDDIIIENLLFIESYVKDELNLKINYYINRCGDYDNDLKYYKNIEELPKDIKIKYIGINFIKA